jgi:hypothetical protein
VKPVEDMQVEATVDEFIDFVEQYCNAASKFAGLDSKPGTQIRVTLEASKTLFMAQRQMRDIFAKFAGEFGKGDSDGPDADAVPAAV